MNAYETGYEDALAGRGRGAAWEFDEDNMAYEAGYRDGLAARLQEEEDA